MRNRFFFVVSLTLVAAPALADLNRALPYASERTSDPTCTPNALTYYKSDTNSLRVCKNGTWGNVTTSGTSVADQIPYYANTIGALTSSTALKRSGNDLVIQGDLLPLSAASLVTSHVTHAVTTPSSKVYQKDSLIFVPADDLPILIWVDRDTNPDTVKSAKCTDFGCSAIGAIATLFTASSAIDVTTLTGVILMESGLPFVVLIDDTPQDVIAINCTDAGGLSCSTSDSAVIAAGVAATNGGGDGVVDLGVNGVGISWKSASTARVRYTHCSDPTTPTTPCSTLSGVVNLTTELSYGGKQPGIMQSDSYPLWFFYDGTGTSAASCSDVDCSGSVTRTALATASAHPDGVAINSSGNVVLTQILVHSVVMVLCNATCTSSAVSGAIFTGSSGNFAITAPIVMPATDFPEVLVGSDNGTTEFIICGSLGCATGNSSQTINDPAPTSETFTSAAQNSFGDVVGMYGLNGSSQLLVVHLLVASTVATGTDVGSLGVPVANIVGSGQLTIKDIVVSGNFTLGGAGFIGDGTATDKLIINVGDNKPIAFQLKSGATSFMQLATTNGFESLALGTATVPVGLSAAKLTRVTAALASCDASLVGITYHRYKDGTGSALCTCEQKADDSFAWFISSGTDSFAAADCDS